MGDFGAGRWYRSYMVHRVMYIETTLEKWLAGKIDLSLLSAEIIEFYSDSVGLWTVIVLDDGTAVTMCDDE